MRPQDRTVFSTAAVDLKLWILVRRTNPASLQYIGMPGYVAKSIDCKAKTADRDIGHRRIAGLVANPYIAADAYLPSKVIRAQMIWDEFAREQWLDRPAGKYKVDLDLESRHYGALMIWGDYIHGDYDLYDVIDPNQPFRNLAAVETLEGVPHMRGPNLERVMHYVNSRIGSEVIKHGGEAQYTDHSEQSIDAFGPSGEECTILNEYSVRAWYDERFGGRRTIKVH